MKKNYCLYTLALFGVGIATINAAPSYNFKVSSGTITNGNKVTASITVSGTASWQIKILSSGNTEGCSNKWADATGDAKNTTKTFSTTCKASSTGVISFRLEGNITDEAGNTVNLSGTKTVTVKEKAPDSKINTLSSLKVDGHSYNIYRLCTTLYSPRLDYTILKTSRNLEIPSLYSETTCDIDGTSIPCFVNENTNITLVALKNGYGVTNFFIYENGKYSKYYELVSDNLIVMPTNNTLNIKGYILKEITINDNKVKAYQYKKLDNDFFVFEGRNLEDNSIHTYLYNQKDNTYILFDNDLYNSLYKDYMFFLYVLGGSAGIIFLSLIIIMIISSKNRKARKFALSLEEKIKHKDKEIEKIKKIYYNNKHKKGKKNNKNNVNGETSTVKIDNSLQSNKEEDSDDTTEVYNILKD